MFKELHVKEALEKGYEILDHADAGKYLYRRIACGHETIAEINNMRHQARTVCRTCNDLEFQEVMKKRKVALVEDRGTKVPSLFKIESCGHIVGIYKTNLQKTDSEYKCPTCYNEEYSRILEECNIEAIDLKSVNDNYSRPTKVGKFRYKDCGHEFNYIRHAIKTASGKCQVCYEKRIANILANNGLTFVKETTVAKAVYKFNSCGHEREVYKSAALRGNCICHICNDTAWSKPSKIYILEFVTNTGFKFIKFGYGKSIKNRIREYRIRDIELTGVLFEFDTQSGYSAMLVEKSIHKDMSKDSLPNDQMKQYFKNTGYSECYNLDCAEVIKKEVLIRYGNLTEDQKIYKQAQTKGNTNV